MPDEKRTPDQIVSAIREIAPPVDLDVIAALLRELTDALVGQDELTVGKYREAAVQGLKRKLGAPAKLVDSAFAPLRSRGQGSLQGETIELVSPEPWPQPVDGAELLDALQAVVRRYIVVGTAAAVAIALWVIHTHAFAASWVTPRLAVTSPVKRCGKSLVLDVLEHLVAKALNVANVTAAAVFRGIERYRPTLLVDEADTFLGDKDELRGILNSGHRRNGKVIRADGDQNEVRAFSTFAPVAIAMIGRLPDTLADRSIPISMRRKKRGEHVERFRADRVGDLEELRSKAVRWALDHWDALEAADPEVPTSLHDRERDNWRPLLAIADAAGGAWPTKAREAAKALSAALASDDEDSIGIVLLGDLCRIFDAEASPAVFTDLLLARLCDLHDRPWAEWRHDKTLTPRATRSVAQALRDQAEAGPDRQQHEEGLRADVVRGCLQPLPPPSRPETPETSQWGQRFSPIRDPKHRRSCFGSGRAEKSSNDRSCFGCFGSRPGLRRDTHSRRLREGARRRGEGMNAEELLAEVEALGVTVHRDGDVLSLRPGSAVPPALVEELRAHKAELLELVDLRGWPEASRECVREFRLPEARLYPFLGNTVATPEGCGRLLEVLPGRAAVELDSEAGRVVFLLPSEVEPPGVAADPDHLSEAVH